MVRPNVVTSILPDCVRTGFGGREIDAEPRRLETISTS